MLFGVYVHVTSFWQIYSFRFLYLPVLTFFKNFHTGNIFYVVLLFFLSLWYNLFLSCQIDALRWFKKSSSAALHPRFRLLFPVLGREANRSFSLLYSKTYRYPLNIFTDACSEKPLEAGEKGLKSILFYIQTVSTSVPLPLLVMLNLTGQESHDNCALTHSHS